MNNIAGKSPLLLAPVSGVYRVSNGGINFRVSKNSWNAPVPVESI